MEKRNKSKIIVRIILDVVLVFAILFGIGVSVMTLTANDNDGVPSLFGYIPVSVLTDSMEGTSNGFNQGDLLFIEKIDDARTAGLIEGDVITFWDFNIVPGTRVLNSHRIVDVLGTGTGMRFETRGDNPAIELDETEITTYSLVVGKYTGTRIPFLGAVIQFMQTSLGFFLCIVLPILVLFIFEGVNLVKVIVENKHTASKE
ncbi:MAG: signal peptidase I [Bacilli bacterium]